MYSENNRRSASRRADADFLRRMLGGELTGDGYPVMNLSNSSQNAQNRSIMGDNRQKATENRQAQQNLGDNRSARPILDQNIPPCDGSANGDRGCPTHTHTPALAMVYSPKQCWRNLLDPASGLSEGTIFAELILPLEVPVKNGTKEVKTRRPF